MQSWAHAMRPSAVPVIGVGGWVGGDMRHVGDEGQSGEVGMARNALSVLPAPRARSQNQQRGRESNGGGKFSGYADSLIKKGWLDMTGSG